MVFSKGIELALRTALDAHAGQFRKGGADLPYVSHPMHVALILARIGLDEVLIQAALLHDVVEDCEGWDDARIRSDFGDSVGDIVASLTEDKGGSWDERKRQAIDHVSEMSTEAAHVKAADKLHNLSSLLHELREAPDEAAVWAHFKGGREKTLGLGRELVDALKPRVIPKLAESLERVMRALEQHVDAG